MLKNRIIPCLDVKNGRVVKGINFVGLKDAGDPVEQAKIYSDGGADEICFLDITASNENRDTIFDVVRETSKKCFVPLTVGGGVRSVEDINKLLNCGADKVSINTAAVQNPDVVKQSSKKFGSQCIVVAIDAKKNNNKWEIFTHGGRTSTGIDAVEFASKYANKLVELREELKKRAPKDSIFDPPFSTLQVGGIFGGIAHNVIADKCRVEWETRPVVKEDGIFLNQQIDKYANEVLLPEMKKVFPNSKITKEIIGEVTGFDRVDNSEACELVSSLTGDNSREVVSFGTEAGLFQEIGISTVVCGPGSIEQAHKVDEFIELNELKKCLKFLEGIKKNSTLN